MEMYLAERLIRFWKMKNAAIGRENMAVNDDWMTRSVILAA